MAPGGAMAPADAEGRPSRKCFLEGPHGMCLAVGQKGAQPRLCMSHQRGEGEAWTLQQLDDRGHRNFVVSASHTRWLAVRNDGEQGFHLAATPTGASIWTLVPVVGESGRFYLRSIHGKHLASLDDKDQTLYMSPGQKEWERWRISPVGPVAPSEGMHQLFKYKPVAAMEVQFAEDERIPLDQAIDRLLSRSSSGKTTGLEMRHLNSQRPLLYGRWFGACRAPCVFLQGGCQEVTDYLAEDPEGPLAGIGRGELPSMRPAFGDAWSHWNFHADEQERLLKADWHAVPHLDAEQQFFVPRRAQGARLSRAPHRVTAFIMALRAVNQPVWDTITDALQALRRAREEDSEEYRREGRGSLLGTFVECFRNQRHFGVVEAQIFWGDEALRQPSHMDGATSLLHLGLTLGGSRTLRSGVFPAPNTVSSSKNVWDESVWAPLHLVSSEMKPGSAYLSSPFIFEHAVEYKPCSAEEPMAALMCRFGFPSDLGPVINNMRGDDMLDIATVVALTLKAAGARGLLRLPTLAEIEASEARLIEQASQQPHAFAA